MEKPQKKQIKLGRKFFFLLPHILIPTHQLLRITKTCKRQIISQEMHYDHGYVTWKSELKENWDRQMWEEIRVHAFRISLDPKLRWFQYRLLSKKLTTNLMRSKWNRETNPACSFCESSAETTLHIMWECKIIRKFWGEIVRWLEYISKIKIQLNAEIVITNKKYGKDKEFIDIVVLIAKQYIYSCKCKDEIPKLQNFAQKLNQSCVA